MPVKRRLAKGRALDEFRIAELMYGPDTCLLAGCGYAADISGIWRDQTDETRAAIIEAMRTDWQLHAEKVWTAWHNRTPHDLQIARNQRGDPSEPWAATEFGKGAKHDNPKSA